MNCHRPRTACTRLFGIQPLRPFPPTTNESVPLCVRQTGDQLDRLLHQAIRVASGIPRTRTICTHSYTRKSRTFLPGTGRSAGPHQHVPLLYIGLFFFISIKRTGGSNISLLLSFLVFPTSLHGSPISARAFSESFRPFDVMAGNYYRSPYFPHL